MYIIVVGPGHIHTYITNRVLLLLLLRTPKERVGAKRLCRDLFVQACDTQIKPVGVVWRLYGRVCVCMYMCVHQTLRQGYIPQVFENSQPFDFFLCLLVWYSRVSGYLGLCGLVVVVVVVFFCFHPCRRSSSEALLLLLGALCLFNIPIANPKKKTSPSPPPSPPQKKTHVFRPESGLKNEKELYRQGIVHI